MTWLELRSIEKTYPGGHDAARQVDLSVSKGEMFVIVGPSGSGKSTLLRLIAGLETPDSGNILLDGRQIDRLAPRDRDVAMVFQDQALYPHLDVFENIAFGLRARRLPEVEVAERVEVAANVLGLGDMLKRRPSTLSGGQRRRVALARAMVMRPKLFLFDEPFSGLDAPLRASTRAELADLRARLDATMILVTHDQADAMAMGDRVAVLDRGRVMQVARPIELYDNPADRFVARFVGQPPMSLLPCLVAMAGDLLRIQVVDLDDVGPWFLPASAPWASLICKHGAPRLDAGCHAEQVRVMTGSGQPDRSGMHLPATVARVEPMGPETVVTLNVGPHPITSRVAPSTGLRAGDRALVELDFERLTWFDSVTGTRIG